MCSRGKLIALQAIQQENECVPTAPKVPRLGLRRFLDSLGPECNTDNIGQGSPNVGPAQAEHVGLHLDKHDTNKDPYGHADTVIKEADPGHSFNTGLDVTELQNDNVDVVEMDIDGHDAGPYAPNDSVATEDDPGLGPNAGLILIVLQADNVDEGVVDMDNTYDIGPYALDDPVAVGPSPNTGRVLSELQAVAVDLDEIVEDDNINDPSYEPNTQLLSLLETGEISEENNDSDFETSLMEDEQLDNVLVQAPIAENNEPNNNTGRPKKGRKIKYGAQTRNIRKKNTNKNIEYVSARGKVVESKPFLDYACKCKNICNDQEGLSFDNRKSVFKKFWELGSYNTQTAFICSLVNQTPIKRKYAKGSEIRKFSRTYTLNGKNVCRDMFTNTLRISSKRVNTALLKGKSEILTDKRGKNGNHNKTSDLRTANVVEQIEKIPKYKSHYCRGENGREFLPTDMTLPKMYEMYKEEYLEPVSFSKYKEIFYSKFNLTRKPLKKDTCNTCDTLKAKLDTEQNEDTKLQLKLQHDEHVMVADFAKHKMKSDLQNAKNDDTLETLTFDLEKTLPLPRIPTNIVFYKRQLWLYNCGIHSGSEVRGHCNVWVEGSAGRGAQEVGSCLRQYVEKNVGVGVRDLILWSDSCGGQNRNIKMVLLLKTILENHPTLTTITQRFLISGHSFLPNDSEFGDIESALKLTQRLYLPSDYIEIMKTCRKRNRLVVYEMKQTDFVGTADIEKAIVNRKKDMKGNKINWLNAREIKIVKDKPYSIFMKTSLSEDAQHMEIDIQKHKKGRPVTGNKMKDMLTPIWEEGKPISQPKLDDLKSMLHLVPSDAKHFYRKLWSAADVEDDIDGFNGDLDFEIEENEIDD